jgi:hypothetical protein
MVCEKRIFQAAGRPVETLPHVLRRGVEILQHLFRKETPREGLAEGAEKLGWKRFPPVLGGG